MSVQFPSSTAKPFSLPPKTPARFQGLLPSAQSSIPPISSQRPFSPPQPAVTDEFFHPKNSLSTSHVSGLFGAGFALALTGAGLAALFKKPGNAAKVAKGASKEAEGAKNIMGKTPVDEMQLNVSNQMGDDELTGIYLIGMNDKSKRGALLGYVGTVIGGYLGGSLAKGAQETWVRRQETLIRAGLINHLESGFRQSIQVKQDTDTELKRLTEACIEDMLRRSGFSATEANRLVLGAPLIEPSDMQRMYAYYPVNRTILPGKNVRFGVMPEHKTETAAFFKNPASVTISQQKHKMLDGGIFAAGLAAGTIVSAFFKLFSNRESMSTVPPKTKVVEYITWLVRAKEGWWLTSWGNKKHMLAMAGCFGMMALAKLGKLAVDGIREVEVTRRNAQTEYLYQTHNWLTQDPLFHRIAEEEAINHELTLLEEQLPILKQDPEKLQERITTLLSNIGRNSAPKYFPMTPPVNLVEARG